jgi:uncharacterized RDD family membrane protein YckC
MSAPVTLNSPLEAAYPYNPAYAGFWRRSSAAFLDNLLLCLAVLVPGFIVGVLFGIVEVALPQDSRVIVQVLNQVISGFIGLTIQMAYYAYFESQQNGITLGRKALGIALIKENGTPITIGQSIKRQVVRLLGWLLLCAGFMVQLFTEKRQAAHDLATQTLVVRTRQQGVWVPWVINGVYLGICAIAGAILTLTVMALGMAVLNGYR